MYGRPMLGNQRMVTVATRIEPDELVKLKQLAAECDASLCAYLRDLIRLELTRAKSTIHADQKPVNGDSSVVDWPR